MYCTMEGAPECCPWILGGAGAWAGMIGFFLDSLYSAKEPRVGIFFLLRPAGAGFELVFRRCSVLPFFSAAT